MQRVAAFVFAWIALGCTACSESSPCDPGYELRNKLCQPLPASVDAAAPSMDAEAPAFGRTCRGNEDCQGPAPVCFKMPSDPSGFCSATGCDADKSICPSDWMCFDLSLVLPGAPFGCVKL